MEHLHPPPFFSRYISHEGAYVQVQQPDPGKQGLFQCQRRRRARETFPGVGGWGLTGEGRREARPVHSFVLFTKLLRSLYIRSRLRSVRQAVGAGGCQSSSLTCVFHL